jgi:hypothetical protein
VGRERKSRASLKQPPVVIPATLRSLVGIALIERLVELGGFVLSAAVSGQHAHLQAKLLPHEVRETAGLAKKHAWFELRDHDWKGKLWGKRGKAKRIRDREHHRHVYQYILNHEREGAWVWHWTKERPMPVVE